MISTLATRALAPTAAFACPMQQTKSDTLPLPHTHGNSPQAQKLFFTFPAKKFGSLKIVTNFALAIEKHQLQTSIMVR